MSETNRELARRAYAYWTAGGPEATEFAGTLDGSFLDESAALEAAKGTAAA
jgi:hypothetical protein